MNLVKAVVTEVLDTPKRSGGLWWVKVKADYDGGSVVTSLGFFLRHDAYSDHAGKIIHI